MAPRLRCFVAIQSQDFFDCKVLRSKRLVDLDAVI